MIADINGLKKRALLPAFGGAEIFDKGKYLKDLTKLA